MKNSFRVKTLILIRMMMTTFTNMIKKSPEKLIFVFSNWINLHFLSP